MIRTLLDALGTLALAYLALWLWIFLSPPARGPR